MKVALIKEESKNTSNSSSVEKNEKKATEEVTKAKNEK